METVKSQIVFRGTEAYHFINYFKRHGIQKNEKHFELMDVMIAVETMPPHIIGRLEITQLSLILQGEASKVEVLEERLRKHFMTAGG